MSRHVLILMVMLASAANAQDAAKPQAAAAKQEKPAKSTAKAADSKAPAERKTDGQADGQAGGQDEVKTLSGISILGNQDSPKSLVIVPWKSSEIGEMPGLSRLLDDSVQPIDKEVFMRELDYYQIRSNSR
jgi:hypothetical protein